VPKGGVRASIPLLSHRRYVSTKLQASGTFSEEDAAGTVPSRRGTGSNGTVLPPRLTSCVAPYAAEPYSHRRVPVRSLNL